MFVFVLIFLGATEDQMLWCSRMLSGEPRIHTIQHGEYLSQLSMKYYGTTQYWRELALINRAPNSDLVFPGEKVIIPSLDAIKRVSGARSLSAVNLVVESQKKWIAENVVEPIKYAVKSNLTEVAADSPIVQSGVNVPEEKSRSVLLPILILFFTLALVACLVILGFRKKRREAGSANMSAEEDEDEEILHPQPPHRRKEVLVTS